MFIKENNTFGSIVDSNNSTIIISDEFQGTFVSPDNSCHDIIVIDNRENHVEETYERKGGGGGGGTDLDIIASDPLDISLSAADALNDVGEDPDKYKIYADGSGNAIGTIDNSGSLDPIWLSIDHNDFRPDENFPITEYPPYISNTVDIPNFPGLVDEITVYYCKADDKFYIYIWI
jgi:hypothetical protein